MVRRVRTSHKLDREMSELLFLPALTTCKPWPGCQCSFGLFLFNSLWTDATSQIGKFEVAGIKNQLLFSFSFSSARLQWWQIRLLLTLDEPDSRQHNKQQFKNEECLFVLCEQLCHFRGRNQASASHRPAKLAPSASSIESPADLSTRQYTWPWEMDSDLILRCEMSKINFQAVSVMLIFVWRREQLTVMKNYDVV